MKTFGQFRQDSDWAIENLIAEAKGFKDAVKRRRKKKQEYLTKWEKKVKKLKDSGGSHWSGLEAVE